MKKKFSGLLMLLLVAACGGFNSTDQAQGDGVCSQGTEDAPIRLEVFSDYECPSCRAFYLQTMKLVFTNYADTGKVCVVYREFPTYEHAREAARFARSALRLGPRQWELVADALYQLQPQWSQTADIEAVVASVLDAREMDAVREHLRDPSLDKTIDDDAIMGLERQVKGTPTSFITVRGETEKVEGALTYAAMQRRLDAHELGEN